MNSLPKEIFPVFNFSNSNSISYEVIKTANLILSHVGCCNSRKCKALGVSHNTPHGWLTVLITALRNFQLEKL